jgi:hypothetical protein
MPLAIVSENCFPLSNRPPPARAYVRASVCIHYACVYVCVCVCVTERERERERERGRESLANVVDSLPLLSSND